MTGTMLTEMFSSQQISREDLWKSTPIRDQRFHHESLRNIPSTARRYLETALSPGISLATTVRLWTHGEIKLGQKCHFLQEKEVLCWNRSLVWQAMTRMHGLPIWGSDQLVDGLTEVQWKILGLFPVISTSGKDFTPSTVGRVQEESVWLPSVLCHLDISWAELDGSKIPAHFSILGESAPLLLTILTIEAQRIVEQVKFSRWGNPEGQQYYCVDFGGIVEQSSTFEGYTIPTHLRLGWFFDSERFESEGEFFRSMINQAIYR